MDRSNKEIQLITIIFNKVIKEKNMIQNKNIGLNVSLLIAHSISNTL